MIDQIQQPPAAGEQKTLTPEDDIHRRIHPTWIVPDELHPGGRRLSPPDDKTPQERFAALGKQLVAVPRSDVAALEDLIDQHEAQLTPLKHFILPGGTPKAAAFHLARTICRRAERSVVTLSHHQKINPAMVHYLNRLSDLLFVMARATNAQAGKPDVAW